MTQTPFSYVVSKVSSKYVLQNGATGRLESFNEDAATVIQAAVDALPNGGKIAFKHPQASVYTLDAGLDFPYSGVSFVGEDLETCIKAADNLDDDMFTIPENSNDIVFHNLFFDGNKDNQASGNIFKISSQGVRIDACRITKAKENNIYMDRPGAYAGLHWITRNSITYAGSHGIYINGAYDTNIIDNDIGQNTGNALYAYAGAALEVTGGNKFWGSINYSNVKFLSFNHITFSDNRVDYGQKTGLWVESCNNCNIENNKIYLNGQSVSNTYDGIYFYGSTASPCTNIQVIGNRIGTSSGTETQRYGINSAVLNSYLNLADFTIKDNNVKNNLATPKINWVGPAIILKDNLGHKTQNSGIVTIQSGQNHITFAHTLAGTPANVTLGGLHDEVKDCIWEVDNTNLTIWASDWVTADRQVSYWATLAGVNG